MDKIHKFTDRGGYYSELVLTPDDLLDLLRVAIQYGEVIIRVPEEVEAHD